MVEAYRAKLSGPNHEQSVHKDLIHLPADHKQLIAEKIARLDIPLSESELEFLEPPNRHNGSDAVYFLEQFIGDDWVLASHLEPDNKTSRHKHVEPMGTEQYYWLAGKAILNVEGEDMPLDSEYNFRAVSLGKSHQLRTENSFALTLIVMKNARSVPPEKRHVRI